MTNMPHTRTILFIVGIGSLFLHGSSAAMAFVAGTSQLSETKSFQWNWRHGQELSAEQSLRKAKVTEEQRKAIAGAIADQIRPMMADLSIESETDLLKAALDTRVKLIDLSADGVREVVAQGMVNCGATGNCPFWVWRKGKGKYELLLEGYAQTFTIQESVTNGFYDIVLSTHGSSSSGDLKVYRYHDGAYQEAGCYDYDWDVVEGEKVRELTEPRLTPCSERGKR
jgi:hypothetical protein